MLETFKQIFFQSTAQYLVVAAWPTFIHMLDIGVTHEPSHHMYFEFSDLILTNPQHKLVSCSSPAMFIFEDMSTETLKLESTRLLQNVKHKHRDDIQIRLALLHYFLIHNSDVNAAKRVSITFTETSFDSKKQTFIKVNQSQT